jgi:hypothetical protein
MGELGRDVSQERCTSTDCKLCPMYCNANQSPCLGGRCSPMLERELNLAYSLFRVQVPKGRSAQACRSQKDDNSGGVATESAFRKDDVHSLLLNSRQFLQTEMTVGQWVSDACQVYGEIVCPSVFVLKCTARDEFPCVVTFIKKHFALFSLVAGGIFLVAKCFVSCEC